MKKLIAFQTIQKKLTPVIREFISRKQYANILLSSLNFDTQHKLDFIRFILDNHHSAQVRSFKRNEIQNLEIHFERNVAFTMKSSTREHNTVSLKVHGITSEPFSYMVGSSHNIILPLCQHSLRTGKLGLLKHLITFLAERYKEPFSLEMISFLGKNHSELTPSSTQSLIETSLITIRSISDKDCKDQLFGKLSLTLKNSDFQETVACTLVNYYTLNHCYEKALEHLTDLPYHYCNAFILHLAKTAHSYETFDYEDAIELRLIPIEGQSIRVLFERDQTDPLQSILSISSGQNDFMMSYRELNSNLAFSICEYGIQSHNLFLLHHLCPLLEDDEAYHLFLASASLIINQHNLYQNKRVSKTLSIQSHSDIVQKP